jgi:hypothetical protein
MDLQEMNGLVGKIRSESDVNVRTAHAEQLMVLAKKDPTRPYGQSLVTQIADLLDDPADSVRYWIATTLGFIGPQASAAVPQLERALVAAEKISASKTSASAIRLAIQRIKGR